MSFGLIKVSRYLLCGVDCEDINHLFFNCTFSHRIQYDLCSTSKRDSSQRFTSVIIKLLSSSLTSVIIKLMLAITVYYIQRKRNARLHRETPRNSTVIYTDIVNYIISKVNFLCNMVAHTDTNRRLHIAQRFSDDVFCSQLSLLLFLRVCSIRLYWGIHLVLLFCCFGVNEVCSLSHSQQGFVLLFFFVFLVINLSYPKKKVERCKH